MLINEKKFKLLKLKSPHSKAMIQSDFVQKTNSASSDSTSSAVYFTEEFSASQLFFVEELNDDLVKKFN